MRALVSAALVLALVAPALAGPKAPIDPDQARNDAALLQDDGAAMKAMQQRLRDLVGFRNGLLVVAESSGGSASVTVFPATVPWSVVCDDSGLSVTFGAGTGDTDNGIAVTLTAVAVPADKCLKLAPAVGETMLALSRGQ
jgi:hypothetical protein